MGYTSSTSLLKLPIWAAEDYMDWNDWNGAWQTIEEAIGDFDYIIDHYGYEMDMSHNNGGMTITLTGSDACPVEASMDVVLATGNDGYTTVSIEIDIDGTVSKAEHKLNMLGGEGGPKNGI